MAKALRWPLLPLLSIGLMQIALCRDVQLGRGNPAVVLAATAALAVVAGLTIPTKPWIAVVVLIIPVMFLGGSYHGRPIDCLLGSVVFPPLLIRFVTDMTPVIAVYGALVWIGYSMRRRILKRRARIELSQSADVDLRELPLVNCEPSPAENQRDHL